MPSISHIVKVIYRILWTLPFIMLFSCCGMLMFNCLNYILVFVNMVNLSSVWMTDKLSKLIDIYIESTNITICNMKTAVHTCYLCKIFTTHHHHKYSYLMHKATTCIYRQPKCWHKQLKIYRQSCQYSEYTLIVQRHKYELIIKTCIICI